MPSYISHILALSLVGATDDFMLLGILLVIVAFSIYGEHKNWFGNISGVLVAIFLSALLASFQLIPSGSTPDLVVPVYDFAFTYLIPFSIPLLLFNIRLKRVFKESGRLLILFCIGAGGVVLGAVVAGYVVNLGANTYQVAGVFTATYTGGSVNFFAVASVLNFLEEPPFAASVVVDNVFTLFYIMLLFLLPKLKPLKTFFPEADRSEPEERLLETKQNNNLPVLVQLALVLGITGAIVGVSMWLSPFIERFLGTDLSLEVLVITVVIIILANVLQRLFSSLEEVAFQLGMYMLYFFLAVVGALCDIPLLFTSSVEVLLFAVIILIVHLAITLLFGRLLKFSLEEIAIASGANVGGVSIASPMAAAFKMKQAVSPAVLIGILGNVIGTLLGVAVGLFMK